MIKRFSDLNSKEYEQVVEIFFETSSVKAFKDSSVRQKFLYKYLGLYKELFATSSFCYLEDRKVLGYICCVPETSSIEGLTQLYPYYLNLQKLLEAYPAHLHVNLTEDSRGKGVGSELITYACDALRFSRVKGVHIFTSTEHPSVRFYEKNGFSFSINIEYNNSEILFMGKSLLPV